MLDQLETKCDDNEQYRRRTSIRIHGIAVPETAENESNDNVMDAEKHCHEKINVPFDHDNIGYVQGVVNKYTDKKTGKKV